MSRRGPKPKHPALKILAGVPGKRPIQVGPIVNLSPSAPEMPDTLSGEAAAEWCRIVPELAASGMLTSVDRAALVAYCQSWAEWHYAAETLGREGSIVSEPIQNSKGRIIGQRRKIHPAVKLQDQAFKRWTKLLTAFGLTPEARDRMGFCEQGSKPAADVAVNRVLAIRDRIQAARTGG